MTIDNTVFRSARRFPTRKYKIIYADCPWKYRSNGLSKYGPAERHYPCMSIKELCALPVARIAEDDAILYFWVTSPMLGECFPVISAWGFRYRTGIVWDKVRHNFGHYLSVRHEILLVCTRGRWRLDGRRYPLTSVVSIERSRTHSEKPDWFRQMIDRFHPTGRRIELFARKKTAGWDVFGNEV